MVDAAEGGTLMSKTLMAKTTDDDYSSLDEMTTNNYQCQVSIQGRKLLVIMGWVSLLLLQLRCHYLLTNSCVDYTGNAAKSKFDYSYFYTTLEWYGEVTSLLINTRNFNQRENNLSNYYHPTLQNHENVSYGSTRNVLQPFTEINNQASEGKPSLEDVSRTFIFEIRSRFYKDEVRLDNIKTHLSNMGAIVKSLKVQIIQLDTSINYQLKGKFPSDK